MDALRVEKILNTVAMPMGKKGGALVTDGRIEERTVLKRGPDRFDDITPEPPAERLKGRFIYAGHLFGHYGHFLLESLSRLWYAKRRPEAPIVWVTRAGRDHYSGMQQALLQFLGVENEPLFVTTPTLLTTVLTPDPGYRIPDFFHPRHAEFLGVRPGGPAEAGKRIWLSRSRLSGRGGVENEAEVEALLQARGWSIVHPELLPLDAQVRELATAEHIAGVEGSAFHTLVLVDRPPARITILSRRPAPTPNLQTIAHTKGLDQDVAFAPLTLVNEAETRAAILRSRWNDPHEVVRMVERSWSNRST